MKISDKFNNLPVSAIAEELCTSLSGNPRLIVTAPPGAGKSTLLPLALLECNQKGKILMLEPRRIAARQVAQRMAAMIDEEIGNSIGYRMRFESKVSNTTRIEVITEGILERILVENPFLEGIDTVIFDEFHERSLSSDLSLALVREIQNEIRPDLKILIMSATIDSDWLCRTLDARHLHSDGKLHDVEVIYGEDYDALDCASVVAVAVRKALRQHNGNILAFLPGQAEILKCQQLLEETTQGVEILTLYGMLSPEEQQKVFTPTYNALRRVVLASPIAETSLTIEGITVVIDSGLYRTPQFNPSTGLSNLITTRISLDMATQRAGRAGRLGPGKCYRLWSKATELRMKDCRKPEIESADLSSMILTTAAWGETNPNRLPWVTPPPSGNVTSAYRLLRMLGALTEKGILTDKGKKISHLPCHPRIAAMLCQAQDKASLACDVAAFFEEKDPLNDDSDADLSTRIALLNQYRKGKLPKAWKKIDNITAQFRRLINSKQSQKVPTPEDIGRLIASAYPERIAMREERNIYKLASGNIKVNLNHTDDLGRHEFLAVASMGSRIYIAAPLDRNYVMEQGNWIESVRWDTREGRVIMREELRLGQLNIDSHPIIEVSRSQIIKAIANAAPKDGLTMFDFNDDVKSLQLRIAVVASWHPELNLPDVSTETILLTAEEWLPLYIGKASTVQELRKIDLKNVIFGLLDYDQQQAVERIAPINLKLPSGRNARIQYRRGAEAPIVSARLQDCFGLMKTPRVDEGKRPVLMELLSPGFKPVQLTQDMENFWKETYFEIRKELRRRYPKHRWPDDPLSFTQ